MMMSDEDATALPRDIPGRYAIMAVALTEYFQTQRRVYEEVSLKQSNSILYINLFIGDPATSGG